MSELNLVKFRKLAISFFLCFPNVKRISFTKKCNHCYIDLWKNVNIQNVDGAWINSSYSNSIYSFRTNYNQNIRNVGLFGRIPIDFLGFNCTNNINEINNFIVDRKALRINDVQININDSSTLNKMVDRICKFSNLKSMTFESFGKINLKNMNNQTFEISMRGSGMRTSIRREITKSC